VGEDRNRSLDIIRGVAVFGLIWVNLGLSGATLVGPNAEPAASGSLADLIASWLAWVLARGKFFSQFSILFGLSLALQLERADARGERIAGVWIRRMAVLLAIGWANFILFWDNDILRGYAIVGTVLLVFRKASNGTVFVAATLAIILMLNDQPLSRVALRVGGGDVAAVVAPQQPSPDKLRRQQEYRRVQREGSYLENVRARAAVLPAYFRGRLTFRSWGVLDLISTLLLPFFLVGFYASRRRILQDVGGHRSILRRAAWVGLTIGLPLNVLHAVGPAWMQHPVPGTGATYDWVVFHLANLILAVGYIAGLLLLLSHQAWQARLSWLAPVGRMGLSNYVAQGLFISTLMLGYGLGWKGRHGQFTNTLAAVAFFAVQVAYSTWWLARFRFGPLEWLWRSATYWRLLPMRRNMPPPVSVQAP
jgi:uncharacterized protein